MLCAACVGWRRAWGGAAVASYAVEYVACGCSGAFVGCVGRRGCPNAAGFGLGQTLVVVLAVPEDACGLESSRVVLVGVVREVLLNKKISCPLAKLRFHVCLSQNTLRPARQRARTPPRPQPSLPNAGGALWRAALPP